MLSELPSVRPLVATLSSAGLLLLASGGLAAQADPARFRMSGAGVTVQGRVVDRETGVSVRSAAVTLWPESADVSGLAVKATDEGGRFLFRDVGAGTHRLSVTALGYRHLLHILSVGPDADLDLVLLLAADPIRLEPLLVEAAPLGPSAAELAARRRTRSAALVVNRKAIEERQPRYLTDLLLNVPGGRVAAGSRFGYTLYLRGGCRPGIWVDGVKISRTEVLDELVPPHSVESIEVYHGFALPVEFGADACGGVLIWTRNGSSSSSEGGSSLGIPLWRRLGMAVGFVLLAVLLSTR